MSSEDDDVVDKVMVVEIKSFAVVRCICKLRLHIHLSYKNARKKRRLMLPTPPLVVLSLFSSIYPP